MNRCIKTESFTHGAACHSNTRAPHGSGDRNHVVDDSFLLRLGDVGKVEDAPHRVRQALQTAAGLLGPGHQRGQRGPLQTRRANVE